MGGECAGGGREERVRGERRETPYWRLFSSSSAPSTAMLWSTRPRRSASSVRVPRAAASGRLKGGSWAGGGRLLLLAAAARFAWAWASRLGWEA